MSAVRMLQFLISDIRPPRSNHLPSPAVEGAARAAGVTLLADALGDPLEGAADVALEVAERSRDRGAELSLADQVAGLLLGRIIDKHGQLRLDAVDKALAAHRAGGEILRLGLARDRHRLAGRERQDEV